VWGLNQRAQNDFYTVFWEQGISGQKRLGIPAQRSGELLYYNLSWAKALGFESPPQTTEQFVEQACAAAKANMKDDDPENDGTGGWIISTDYPVILGWIYANGAEILKKGSDQGGAVYQFDTPEVEAAFTFLRELYDDGCAWLAESQYPEAEFANRLGLFSTGSVMDIPYQVDAFRGVEGSGQWTVIPFPSPDGGSAFNVYGPSYSVLSSSPEGKLASWVFIRWLLEPQNQARFVEMSGSFPLRADALDHLEAYGKLYPQWLAASEALAAAHPAPDLQSWGIVRWTLKDAATQLFRFYFTIDQVPGLIRFLDQTANELHGGSNGGIAPGVAPWSLTPESTNSPGETPASSSEGS